MIIDDDGDDESHPRIDKHTDFEDEDDEDPSRPYEPVTATHEISLHASVFALAVPPVSPDRSLRDSSPSVLQDRLVIAVACSDRTVRLVSLPQDPKTSQLTTKVTTNRSKNDVQCKVVTEPHVHDGTPRTVAFSYTSIPTTRQGWHSNDEDVGKMDTQAELAKKKDYWQLLVASHAAETTPTLAVTRLQFSIDHKGSSLEGAEISTDAIFPENSGVSLCFNPARYPSKRHSQLLFAESTGTVRLYDALVLKRKYLGRPTFVNPDVPPEFRTRLLATFFAPFQRPSDPILQAFGLRHRVLDASWALNGKAIIVLLDDGRWGIWDYLEAGTKGPQSSRSGPQSVPNTGLTTFSIQGFLGSQPDDRSMGLNQDSVPRGSSLQGLKSLAPMTPNTRKSKQQHLFSPPSGGLSSRRIAKGKLSISTNIQATNRDESVILWYDGYFSAIPSLLTYWKRAVDGYKADSNSSGLSTLHGPGIPQLPSLSTLGEMVTSISQLPGQVLTSSNQLFHDIIVSAEHRVVMWCPEKPQRKSTEQLSNLFKRTQPPPEEGGRAIQRFDQDRLSRQELDLGGIDRVLGNMNSGRTKSTDRATGSPLGRRHSARGPRFTKQH